MATQDSSGIDFSILPEESQQRFRLLELPPELLSVLTSDHPPILQLKSHSGTTGSSNAVLCTTDKTFDVRQVSTSNTVLIAESVSAREADSFSQPRLQAIAQPQSTLEVSSRSDVAAATRILSILPAYTSTGHYTSKDAITKAELFANIPCSDAECEDGWRELACFEIYEAGCSVVPSTSIKLKVWESLLSAATAQSINLTEPVDERSQSSITEQENEWPIQLSIAILRSMAASVHGELQLDREICAKSVGRALLKDRTDASGTAMPVSAFITAWADLLPEQWRISANLTLIEGWYSLENGAQDISYVEKSAGITDTSSSAAAPAEVKSTLGAKRKWHEKFRASKKS